MRSVYQTVQDMCLGLPETSEYLSHSFPTFKVKNKNFATYSVNHHGDGKVALLLNSSHEQQQMLVESAPKHFFVPPYIGSKGWIGLELNKGLAWQRVSQLVFDAYVKTAPISLSKNCQPIRAKAPTQQLKPEDIDPLQSGPNQKIVKQIREICLALPESLEGKQFGNPCFKAGKKTFASLSHHGKIQLQIWVGADRQDSLTSFDQRYEVPAYVGHNGWIDLDLSTVQNWREISNLLLDSYKHFALKRMLSALD